MVFAVFQIDWVLTGWNEEYLLEEESMRKVWRTVHPSLDILKEVIEGPLREWNAQFTN